VTAVSYWVAVSEHFWAGRADWTKPLRVVFTETTRPSRYPRCVDVLVHDEDADPELDGQLVDIVITATPDGPRITQRTVVRR
jgi:hypothetical protein